jgi:hypothetical protein
MNSGITSAKNAISRELPVITAEMKSMLEHSRNKWWHYLIGYGVPVLLVIPIALHIDLFNDDFGRASFGAIRWHTDGRLFSEFLYRFAHLGSNRSVLEHPLGEILCLPLMLAGGFFNALIFKRKSIIWPGVLAVLLFGQPYFLENLSYSFDAPLMVSAVSMCLIASWLCTLSNRKFYVLCAGTLVTLSLLVYQPANNAFWIPPFLLLISRIGALRNVQAGTNSRELNGKIILKNIIAVELSSLLLYKILFAPFFRLSSYANHAQKLPGVEDFLPNLLDNLMGFVQHLLRDGFNSPLGVVAAIYIFISVIVISGCPSRTKSITKFFLILVVLVCSQGVMSALTLKGMPARTFIGFGVFLSSIMPLAWISSFERSWGQASKAVFRRVYIFTVGLFLWGLISCSFSYGNAFSSQAALNDYYRQVISNSILRNESYISGQIHRMYISGMSPSSLVVTNTVKTYPFLKPMLNGISGDFRGINNFRKYGIALHRSVESEKDLSIAHGDKNELVLHRSDLQMSIDRDIVHVHFK